MPTKKEVNQAFDAIIARQIESVKKVATTDKIQDDKDIKSLLLEGVKKQIKMSLDNLCQLYDEFIENDECTLQTALEYVPLFTVNGLINGAQLGITQDEYYMIVDYYLEQYDLIAR